MAIIKAFGDGATNAATDKFVKFQMKNYPLSITVDTKNVVGTAARYSLMVCNFNGSVAEFRELNPTYTTMALSAIVDLDKFHFDYMAINYKANGDTGTVQIYINSQDPKL